MKGSARPAPASPGPRSRGARGSVLPVVLLFSLLLAVAAGHGMRRSVLELRLGVSLQLREELRQWAAGAVGAVAAQAAAFPLDRPAGFTLCGGAVVGADCGGPLAGVAEALGDPPAGLLLSYRVRRSEPEVLPGVRVRLRDGDAAAGMVLDIARFEITATADGRAWGAGSVTLLRGVALALPGPGLPARVALLHWRESGVDEL